MAIQAARLKETIDVMNAISAGQAKDVRDSIGEATRAAKAMEDQNQHTETVIDLMRGTAEIDLRAYVGISRSCIKERVVIAPNGIAQGAAIEAYVRSKNFGRTPAYKVTHWAILTIGKYPVSEPLKWSEYEHPAETIMPQGGESMLAIGINNEMVIPIGTEFGNKAKTVYVHGEITYSDIFGKSRRTRYKFSFGGGIPLAKERDSKGEEFYILHADTDGNEAT